MTTIITKNSSTASAVPASGDLVAGELAVNTTDKKIFTKNASGTVVKVVGSLGNQESNAVAITGGTITGMGTPSASSDVSTKGYVDGLISTGSASAAAAAASASAASTSASNAATSATNAATSASSASTSATSAASAQSAAEAARDATLLAYDNFDDRYLGTKASDPTVDNDGNALLAGSLYFNSTSQIMKLYTGSAWVAAYISGAGYATLTGTETLTNKTLTAPVLTTPNITTGLTVTGSAGTSGQVLTSAGSGSAPTWTTISSSIGIATYTNQSANVTLTAADINKVLSFTLANDITVTLPDATTLTGAKNLTIKNNSSTYGIFVSDGAGNYLFAIQPKTSQDIFVTNTSTAAGSWTTSNLPTPYLTEPTTDLPLANTYIFGTTYTATLSSTQAIITYVAGINLNSGQSSVYAVVVTNTSGVLTYGTPALIGYCTTSTYCPVAVTCLSSTSGIVVFDYNAGASYPSYSTLFAVGFTVSGTTITTGTGTVLNNQSRVGSIAIANASSTTAFFAFAGAANQPVSVNVLTLSGTTVTAGSFTSTPVSHGGLSNTVGITALTGSLGVVSYVDTSTGTLTFSAFTAAAGAITAMGTNASTALLTSSSTTITALNSSKFVAGATDGGGSVAVVGSVSGTTVSLGSLLTVCTANSNTCAIVAESATSAIVMGSTSTLIQARKITISGTTITNATNTYTTLGTTTGASYQYITVIPFQTIAVGAPNTTSVLATYQDTTAFGQMVSQNLTESGGVITVGTTYSQNFATPGYFLPPQSVAPISTSQFVEICNGPYLGFPNALYARLYSVSNGTFTLQNTLTITNTAYTPVGTPYGSDGSHYCIFPITSTLVGIIYRVAGALAVNTISISGSSLTLNTGITVTDTTTYKFPAACMLTPTSFVMVGYNVTGNTNIFRTVSISGTTLTANAPLSLTYNAEATTYHPAIAALSSTQVLCAISTGTGATYSVYNLSISGTDVVGDSTNPFQVAINRYAPFSGTSGYLSRGLPTKITPLSSTKALISVARTPVNANGIDGGLTGVIYDFSQAYKLVSISGISLNNQPVVNGNVGGGYGALVPTSSTGGVFVAAYGSSIAYQNQLNIGTWGLQGTTILFNTDFSSAGKFNHITYGSYYSPVIPYTLAAPGVGLVSSPNVVLRYGEYNSNNPNGTSNAIVLRKYSYAGAVN